MKEILLFTGVGIALYLLSDWIVRKIEERRGAPMAQRQVVFFVVFLTMALISFQVLQRILCSAAP